MSSDKLSSESSAVSSFPVAVIMQRNRVRQGKWESIRWDVEGVVVGEQVASTQLEQSLIHSDEQGEKLLWKGFSLILHPDECESYYFNIVAETPRLFVMCRKDEVDDLLEPFLISASYDEAASYMEGGDEVFSVPMPPEIYQWLEGYVLRYYVPEKRKKRKLVNWCEEER